MVYKKNTNVNASIHLGEEVEFSTTVERYVSEHDRQIREYMCLNLDRQLSIFFSTSKQIKELRDKLNIMIEDCELEFE